MEDEVMGSKPIGACIMYNIPIIKKKEVLYFPLF
jgi:hypothetical protein